jgi:phosphoglucomutase
MKEKGLIPAAGSTRACIIKTFVTSGLQDEIGRAHCIKVIDTLTGFKWIAAKLLGYEQALVQAMGPGFEYDATTIEERVRLHLRHGTFFAFGSEESYGYLPNDMVRDKDGNAACLMFAELCAWVKTQGLTVPEHLDRLYARHGFYLEGTINIYYEGASGSEKIGRIIRSYRTNRPAGFGGVAVASFQDFGLERILDDDGEEIPKQDLYVVTLTNGYRFAARASGTEPKMKFYLFAKEKVPSPADLPAVKARVKAELERLKRLIEEDAKARAGG